MAETESKRKKSSKDAKKSKKNDDAADAGNTMSEEDRELKERLETCVSTLINEANESSVTVPIRLKALDVIVTELRSATSSMTSVPKPLKFLRPKFEVLKSYHGSIGGELTDRDLLFLRARLGDVLAVLAMTLGKHGKRFCLHVTLVVIVSRLFRFVFLIISFLVFEFQRREKASSLNLWERKITKR